MKRLIFHVDVNSAYLSWESARRVAAGETDLRTIPAAIGGDRENRTGVILAKSIPARKLGVRTGEPVAMALRKCPDLVLARPDFRLYETCSKAFMDICRKYAPAVEKYSIDECFLDMTGTGSLYPEPVAIACRIKDEIRDTLGFTVNVGVGGNKLLAKMASEFEKPDKVHTLFPEEIPDKMWPLPVGELFTVGRATAERLKKARIATIGDLAHQELRQVQAILGVKLGGQLWNYANGVDESPVRAEPEPAKCYGSSTTLSEDVRSVSQAHKVLFALSDSVTARMRADHTRTGCVAVTIRSSDFKDRSHQRKLQEPTDVTSEVYEVSKALFAELWDGHTPLRLLGINLSDLTRDGCEQQSLFPNPKRERERKLDRTMDDLRNRFGADMVVRGAAFQSYLRVGQKYRAQLENQRHAADTDKDET